MSLLFLSIAFAPAPEAVWPTSVSGWVALVTGVSGLLVAVVGGGIAYGRALARQEAAEARMVERMNGFGERVGRVEATLEGMAGADVERVRQLDSIVHDHKNLIEKIGQAAKATDNCREENDQHTLVIGSRQAELERQTRAFQLSMSQRMARVETKAKLLPADFENGE